jgi:hypothetical protein
MFNLGSILDRGPMHGQEDRNPDAGVIRTMATPMRLSRR